MPVEEINHVDILGQPISDNSYVVACHANTLYVCQVKKISPRMLRVCPVKGYYRREGWLKYPSDLIVLSGPDALAYILTHAGA